MASTRDICDGMYGVTVHCPVTLAVTVTKIKFYNDEHKLYQLTCHISSSLFCHNVSDEEKHFTMTNISILITSLFCYSVSDEEKRFTMTNISASIWHIRSSLFCHNRWQRKVSLNMTPSLILVVNVLAYPYCETTQGSL